MYNYITYSNYSVLSSGADTVRRIAKKGGCGLINIRSLVGSLGALLAPNNIIVYLAMHLTFAFGLYVLVSVVALGVYGERA